MGAVREKQEIAFDIQTMQVDGRDIEVLVVSAGLDRLGNTDEDQCVLCGFKIRAGKHSYAIHQKNGGVDGKPVLLPVNEEVSERESLGFWAIGSDCRKRLPQQFVINWTEWAIWKEVK